MLTYKRTGQFIGILLLLIFISGVAVFQVLQGSVLFLDDFLNNTSANSDSIVWSVLLGIFSGLVSIVISALIFPIFKKYNLYLALLYFAFCVLNFIAVLIDNVSVISMLELSKSYVESGRENTLGALESLVYERHYWTHYFYLLISCFPVFVLFYFQLFHFLGYNL